jgi:hypothetical protein
MTKQIQTSDHAIAFIDTCPIRGEKETITFQSMMSELIIHVWDGDNKVATHFFDKADIAALKEFLK